MSLILIVLEIVKYPHLYSAIQNDLKTRELKRYLLPNSYPFLWPAPTTAPDPNLGSDPTTALAHASNPAPTTAPDPKPCTGPAPTIALAHAPNPNTVPASTPKPSTAPAPTSAPTPAPTSPLYLYGYN